MVNDYTVRVLLKVETPSIHKSSCVGFNNLRVPLPSNPSQMMPTTLGPFWIALLKFTFSWLRIWTAQWSSTVGSYIASSLRATYSCLILLPPPSSLSLNLHLSFRFSSANCLSNFCNVFCQVFRPLSGPVSHPFRLSGSLVEPGGGRHRTPRFCSNIVGALGSKAQKIFEDLQVWIWTPNPRPKS